MGLRILLIYSGAIAADLRAASHLETIVCDRFAALADNRRAAAAPVLTAAEKPSLAATWQSSTMQ